MESLELKNQSLEQVNNYISDNHLMPYERGILKEIVDAIGKNDHDQLDWFNSFGEQFRVITMNLYAYRKGLEFGFTEIEFDKYGWFKRPEWLNKDELRFGDTSRYGNYSSIDLGCGKNHTWTYGMSYNFGVAGGSYGLSAYGKQFRSRELALTAALIDLKDKMSAKIGSTDTTNDKQPIILQTIRDIAKAQIGLVQLSLF